VAAEFATAEEAVDRAIELNRTFYGVQDRPNMLATVMVFPGFDGRF
jgi:hypothetical protein